MVQMCGIDGCKAGWLAISTNGNNYQFGIYRSLFDLAKQNPNTTNLLIDIPIGLASLSHKRTIDSLMRKELPGRASTVFNAPCRMAAYAPNYGSAKQFNIEIVGKSLTQQSFHISPKIRDADTFIQDHPEHIVSEGHPEISFKYLDQGNVLHSKKSTVEGLQERMEILEHYNRKAPDIFQKISGQTLRKSVRKDDIIDALCLAVTQEISKGNLDFILDKNSSDEKGIKIRVGYYNPQHQTMR